MTIGRVSTAERNTDDSWRTVWVSERNTTLRLLFLLPGYGLLLSLYSLERATDGREVGINYFAPIYYHHSAKIASIPLYSLDCVQDFFPLLSSVLQACEWRIVLFCFLVVKTCLPTSSISTRRSSYDSSLVPFIGHVPRHNGNYIGNLLMSKKHHFVAKETNKLCICINNQNVYHSHVHVRHTSPAMKRQSVKDNPRQTQGMSKPRKVANKDGSNKTAHRSARSCKTRFNVCLPTCIC